VVHETPLSVSVLYDAFACAGSDLPSFVFALFAARLSYYYPLSLRDYVQIVPIENDCGCCFGLPLWFAQRQQLTHPHSLKDETARRLLSVLLLYDESFSTYAVDGASWLSSVAIVCRFFVLVQALLYA
jgi:hypothetical protein